MDDVLVIGGGAAGMMAAWRAASLGTRTRLLEKNDRLGLKIHISGGGKCNITHGGEMEPLRRAFAPEEARFLREPFRRFTNADVLRLLRERGVTVHTRSDGRVFPDSGRADDVVDALEHHVRRAGAQIEFRSPVERLLLDEGRVAGAAGGGREWRAGAVIVAVGGNTYPKTGTTGDGFRWMREVGHQLAPLRAALAPIYLDDGKRPEYSGVALRDCVLRVRQNGKELARWRGDLLFTHQGISGPTVLGVSRAAAVGMERGDVTLDVDLLPDVPQEALAARFAAAHGEGRRRTVRALVEEWLPDRLAPEALERAGLEPSTPLHQLPRKNRNRLVDTLKRWDLGRIRAIPLERGEVTAGGVSLDEVDPTTMASRVRAGLYLAGEVLDIAGPVGGYNLQAAFSTGYVAGEAAARAASTSQEAGRAA
ncbi:MAG: NAD(P)/FAD-dependent oxidoreductase [Armatimonadota bacterium]